MAKKKQELSNEERLAAALVREEDWPYGVPGNWVWVKFKLLAEGQHGAAFKSTEYSTVGIPIIRMGNVVNTDTVKLTDKTVFIPNERLNEFKKYILNNNDIVMTMTDLATKGEFLGTVAIYKSAEIAFLNQRLLKINFNKQLMSYKFLFYSLRNISFRNYITQPIGGSIQKNISADYVFNYNFPLPPLAEQQRIVDRIESLFDQLDQAKALIQEALDSFENRKAAILHQAFTGVLTKKWREEHGVGMESWEEVPFNKFCLLKRGYDLPSKERTQGAYPLVSSSGVIDSHYEYKVKGPGIVTGRSGTLGKVYYVEDNYWPLNTTLYSKEIFDNYPRYIYYYLSQFDFKKFSSSTAVPTLNRNNFSEIPILKPKYTEQQEIVRILDDLLEKEQVAFDLCDLIDQIDTIKKTILGKAFRGELGTNVVGEESAVELLKEILYKN